MNVFVHRKPKVNFKKLILKYFHKLSTPLLEMVV